MAAQGTADFEGDLLLKLTEDGAELEIENGLIMPEKGFNTSVLISLFGGNIEDSGKVANRAGWWGNYSGANNAESKIQSRLQAVTNGQPLTVASAKEAINAAKLDLDWLKSTGAADEIVISGKIADVKWLDLEIKLIKDGANIFSNVYAVNWEAQQHGAGK